MAQVMSKQRLIRKMNANSKEEKRDNIRKVGPSQKGSPLEGGPLFELALLWTALTRRRRVPPTLAEAPHRLAAGRAGCQHQRFAGAVGDAGTVCLEKL